MDLFLDALNFLLNVYLTVSETIQILKFFGNFFRKIWLLLKCAIFILCHFLQTIVIL